MIVDLKKPGVSLGQREKNQVWEYVKELRERGHLRTTTNVVGYVLGDRIASGESEEDRKGNHVAIRPMLYTTFVRRAEKRMLNLRERLLEAPFMKDAMTAFQRPVDTSADGQEELTLSPVTTV